MSVISPTRKLGPVVRRLRDDAGVKQKDLAEAAGIHVNTLLAFEKGRSDPDAETVQAIAEALGVSLTVIEAEANRGTGHYVVRDTGEVAYDPNSDVEATVAADIDAILAWLPPDMSRRITSEVTTRTRLAEVYAYGASQGWSKERLAFIHSTIERLDEV